MPSDCVFCKIVEGKLPCYKIYEDKSFLAFLDVNPLHIGHILVITKKHFKDMFDIPKKQLSKIMSVIKKIMVGLDKTGFGEGYTLLQSNRHTGNQDIFHIHFHIIPRKKGDHCISFKKIEKPSEQQMQEIANKIKNSL